MIALLEVAQPDFISAAAEKGIYGYVQPVISANCPNKCQYIVRTKEVNQKQINRVSALIAKDLSLIAGHLRPPTALSGCIRN